jgi:hypothetical protein
VATKKTWKEKLANDKGLPKVEPIPDRMVDKWGSGTLVIPTPLEVDQLMRTVPKGKLTTINEIRSALATKHRTSICCPITTGIFAWISSHAAEEVASEKPNARITPYWRTLKTGGLLNEKYPGGVVRQKKRLIEEVHKVAKKGKHFVVVDHQKKLSRLK